MNALQELTRQALENKRAKYPNIPAHCLVPPKYKDSDANGLTTCIIDYLRFNGCFAARINSTGLYDEKLGKYRKSGSTNGLPDILGVCSGLMLGVEVKMNRDVQSPAQKEIQSQIEAAGGKYFIAKTFQSFYDFFAAIKEALD